MNEAQEIALVTLETIFRRRKQYDAVNKSIKELQSDFPSLVSMMDEEVERSVVKTLDAILGDEIANYFLYEVPSLKGGGKITETDGREWTIQTLDDVKAYVARPRPQLTCPGPSPSPIQS